MSGAYMADGRRRSSMAHAKHGHTCDFCGQTVFGNGAKVSHGRKHVRAGEAVELVRYFDASMTGRIFFAVDDQERIDRFLANGYSPVDSP